VDKKLKYAFYFLVLFGIAAIGLLFIYSDGVSVLSPQGMIGEKQRDLLMLSTYIMLFVVVPVFILTFFICWKYRASNKKATFNPDWDHSHIAEAIWWGFPLVIIIILSVITWKACHELDPSKPLVSDTKPLKVQVVALQWKWLFIYPEQGIATVNFLEFPEKTPIEFEITSDAPMNSFWIPDLGGQIYAMAGMRSKLHLIANAEGTYRGFSSNISGKGFSGMTFMAKSTTRDEFDQWVASVKQAPGLSFEVYDQLAKPSEYNSPANYSLSEPGLFNWIIMKYMMPMPERMGHASVH
jgi:cytochrome o ubiquinol oxidase subunit 2